jgi:hypothetical protein
VSGVSGATSAFMPCSRRFVRRMREATWGKVRRDGRERKGRKCVIL